MRLINLNSVEALGCGAGFDNYIYGVKKKGMLFLGLDCEKSLGDCIDHALWELERVVAMRGISNRVTTCEPVLCVHVNVLGEIENDEGRFRDALMRGVLCAVKVALRDPVA